jgi:hypothetical protein
VSGHIAFAACHAVAERPGKQPSAQTHARTVIAHRHRANILAPLSAIARITDRVTANRTPALQAFPRTSADLTSLLTALAA